MRAFFGFVFRDFRERKFRACLEREREGLKREAHEADPTVGAVKSHVGVMGPS
jgi:hypothetical protein